MRERFNAEPGCNWLGMDISKRERVSTIWKETFDKNRKTLESFRED